jgi:hypothetical protein
MRGVHDEVAGCRMTPAPERPEVDVEATKAAVRARRAAAPVSDVGLREALIDGVMGLGCRHKADFEYGLVEPGECLVEVDRVLGVIDAALRQAEKETA